EDHQFYLEALAHAKATISGKGFYSIQPGQSEQIKVQVTAEDGTKGAIYTFNVSRKNASNENQLLDLFVIVNGVRTNLDVNLKSYVITVPIDITSITIGAIAPEF